jgi:hypothetical protein
LHERVNCGDIHVYIFPNFIEILKFIFQIKGTYGHGIKSVFSIFNGYLAITLTIGPVATHGH